MPRALMATTSPASYALSVGGDVRLSGRVFKWGEVLLHTPNAGGTRSNLGVGYRALANAELAHWNVGVGSHALRTNVDGSNNTAVGAWALGSNVDGSHNTAVGERALRSNVSGEGNTAIGRLALESNRSGSLNTAAGEFSLLHNTADLNSAFGAESLRSNTTGFQNTALGHAALRDNVTGRQNTAVGQAALLVNTSGSHNTAVGEDALRFTTGSRNIALGRYAGRAATTGSNNIFLGNIGASSDSATIRIGTLNTQAQVFVAGISNAAVSDADVMIDTSTGRLGIATSSRRFKLDVEKMGEASRALLDLRPVTFRRRTQELGDPSRLEFGLIAEEVAETFPELVIYDQESEPYAVRYHLLPSLMLNELQRQKRSIDLLRALLAALVVTTGAVTVVLWRRS
jgi:hypothetical protein